VEQLYFPCQVRMKGADTFLLWYQDERDGFVRHPSGQLLSARSLENLASIAAEIGLSLVPDEPVHYDFDQLQEWCDRIRAEGVDCPAFLNAWNFFDDLARLHDDRESHYAKLSQRAAQRYDKLFWGNNLPSMTPPGERFTPIWSAEELEDIHLVMEAGLRLIGAELALVEVPP
jgi:hypothetical protein